MLGLLALTSDPVGIHSIARGLTFNAAYTAKSLKNETPRKKSTLIQRISGKGFRYVPI